MFDFVNKRKWYFTASGVVILIGIIALIISGLNLGLDFKPGTTMTLVFKESVESEDLLPVFSDLGYSDAVIQSSPKDAFLFEDLPQDKQEAIVDSLQSSLTTTIRLAEFESAGNATTIALIIGKSIDSEDLAKELDDIPWGNATLGVLTFEKTTLDSYLVRIGEQEQESTIEKVSNLPLRQLQAANATTVEPIDQPTANETATEPDDPEVGANETTTEPIDEQDGANETIPEPTNQPEDGNVTAIEPDINEPEVFLSGQQQIKTALQGEFGSLDYLDYSVISAAVSSERVNYTIYAVLVAAIGILLYVGWAFRKLSKSFRFGVCAIIALIHDVLIVLALFALFRLEVNAMFIIAELTVIGYSVNNTIVIFDRIRENRMRHLSIPFDLVVNRSLNETVTRSLNTSLTTLFVLLSLFLFGGDTISNFILALIIGVVAGTYSSLFIASQLVVAWERGEIQRLFSWIPMPRRERET